VNCPHCRRPIFRKSASGDRLKARVSILVLHKGGDVEVNCPHCRRGVLVPLRLDETAEVRKATSPRLVTKRS
jgi:hypothetical protein